MAHFVDTNGIHLNRPKSAWQRWCLCHLCGYPCMDLLACVTYCNYGVESKAQLTIWPEFYYIHIYEYLYLKKSKFVFPSCQLAWLVCNKNTSDLLISDNLLQQFIPFDLCQHMHGLPGSVFIMACSLASTFTIFTEGSIWIVLSEIFFLVCEEYPILYLLKKCLTEWHLLH